LIFGEGACSVLSELLLKVDNIPTKKKRCRAWLKIKHLIEELHWKISDFLTKNYDHILLPDFKTSQMVIKGKKLSKMTRRLMNMFSFYKFKEKLQFKCNERGRKLYIVDESFTSKTCSVCGKLNDVQGKETFTCETCHYKIDRDVSGSRNILIKNLKLI
jgi:IS605 OrfB family transposase